MTALPTSRPRDRVPTGVPGLDEILNGGFLRHGVYMIQGRPGGGKTILANQLAFHHASEGGRVVYATLLAETHERMLFNLEPLSFFDLSRVPDQVTYLSAFSTLEEVGLPGLIELLRREARLRKATLLVLDGLVAVQESGASTKDLKRFIYELQIQASLVGCTIVLVTSADTDNLGPEHTMVDGVIDVADNRIGRHTERELEVKKFRGSAFLRGGHQFQITDAGVAVFPRIEAILKNPSPDDSCDVHQRVSTGMPGLDEALHGGLPCGSTTVLFGPTGVGKTTVGLNFLDTCTKTQPGLLFGFYETPPRILAKADALSLDLSKKKKAGILDVIWFPPIERSLDALGSHLMKAVRARGVKRLVVDGVDGFLKLAAHPERISHFLSALTNELRTQGVTTLYTMELQEMFSPSIVLPMRGISNLVENVILMRTIEQGAQVKRALSIVKLRDSDYDPTVREFRISAKGSDVGEPVFTKASTDGAPFAAPDATGPVKKRKGLLRRGDREP